VTKGISGDCPMLSSVFSSMINGACSRRGFGLPVAAIAVVLIAACSCGPTVAPPANITVENSPDRKVRRKYLYTVVADCDSCRAERDYSRLYAPVTASGKGSAMI
jgi:hypothetical protein